LDFQEVRNVYSIDREGFEKALKAKGYASLGDLARDLRIHRNTLHYYLSGRGIFPKNFERVLAALDLRPGEILVRKRPEEENHELEVARAIDRLHEEYPKAAYVLFGSRAEGRAHRYSDWDVGIYAAGGLAHEVYRRLLRDLEEWTEDLPVTVDLVNLNRADPSFLKKISRHWKFLTGRLEDWYQLQKKAPS
jgi:predicted nucleotidyltransferase